MSVSSAPSSAVTDDAPGARAEPGRATAELLEHEYDGIREYDNPLPGWWVKIFWGSFFFAIGYGFHYHFSGNGVSVAAAYEQEMTVAREEQARREFGETVSEDGLEKLMLDAKLMADAKGIFTARCTPCHGDQAQGVIGPNLTDAYWLHGKGTLMDIFQDVNEGFPAKGMPAWKMQLSPLQVRELAAYIGSLRGKSVPGKAPEGSLITSEKP